MARGASPKRQRQYEHIRESAKKSGRYGGRAEEVAARTVNKIRREMGETKTQRSRSKKASTKRSRRASRNGRGFAGMSGHRQRVIAAEGGRVAHERGTAHEFSSAEARKAGQKGGEAVSRDRSHMAKIGRKGGKRGKR